MINTFLLALIATFLGIYLRIWFGWEILVLGLIIGAALWCVLFLINFFVKAKLQQKEEDKDERRKRILNNIEQDYKK